MARVLVLGASGLIGSAVCRHLLAEGHAVSGLQRPSGRGAIPPGVDRVAGDLAHMTAPADWSPVLQGVDAVVNAAGVLQDGLGDDVDRVQRQAVEAMVSAAGRAGVRQIVQISAPGVSEDATTAFYRTKAAGDAAVRAGEPAWTILRPALVLAPQAYGGTRLLRMLAAVPVVQPVAMAGAEVATVALDDVAQAVSEAVSGAYPGGDFDLVEPGSRPLHDLILSVRRWLGFAPPRAVLVLPGWLGGLAARGGDLAGWFGWRPALRTTAMAVLADGVTGDGRAYARASGRAVKGLEETLAALPSTAQERVAARAVLVFPVLVLGLAAFWLLSGVIGLVQFHAAMAVLPQPVPRPVAGLLVAGGGVLDLALGIALLFRRTVRAAALGTVALACLYALAAAVLTPALWADPLGPMVKILPAMALGLGVAALAEDR